MSTTKNKVIRYRPEIRFADIDSYGIVHNAVFLLYFEQSRIRLFKEIAGDWDWKENGVLVARQELDYKRPVRLGDILEIVVWVESIGSKSMTCAYEASVLVGDKKRLCTESRTVIVCFNHETNSTSEVPREWRNAVEKNGLLGRPE